MTPAITPNPTQPDMDDLPEDEKYSLILDFIHSR
jgi:hypothetical protein